MDFIDFLMTRYQEEKQFKKSRSAGESVEKDKKRKSNFGSARGMIVMRSDFDEPLEDFKESASLSIKQPGSNAITG